MSSKTSLKLWQKGASGQLGRSLGKQNEGMAGTMEFVSDQPLLFDGQTPLYFSFVLSRIKYFAQVKIQSLSSTGMANHYQLQLVSELFRTEKREHERLMVYPLYRALAYFALPTTIASNITSIHGKSNDQGESFARYLKKKFFVDEKWGEMTGLQIIDISASGLSCIANPQEAELLMERESAPLVIDLKGQFYRVSQSRIVYNVDYIDPRFQKVRMRKIGIEFSTILTELNEQLEQFQNNSVGINSLEASFEDILS